MRTTSHLLLFATAIMIQGAITRHVELSDKVESYANHRMHIHQCSSQDPEESQGDYVVSKDE
jgi:hypothetical protein